MGKTGKRLAIGTAVAAVAGYVAGILTAPKSGRETRSSIKHAATQGVLETEKQLKKLHTQLNTLLADAKTTADSLTGKARAEFESAIDASKAVREKAREVLSAAHDGDVEDKDLKKAVDEATQAVEHLKTFLKKHA